MMKKISQYMHGDVRGDRRGSQALSPGRQFTLRPKTKMMISTAQFSTGVKALPFTVMRRISSESAYESDK